MYAKLFVLLAGMLLTIICGYVSYPAFFTAKPDAPTIASTGDGVTGPTPDGQPTTEEPADDGYTPPPSIAVNEDGEIGDVAFVDDGQDDASVLDTWGTEPASDTPPAGQDHDINDYTPDDEGIVVIEQVKEADIPIDPAQQRVTKVLDATRRNKIKSQTKKIANILEKEAKKNNVKISQEFEPEMWRKPELIRKQITERCLQRLGNLSSDSIWAYMENPNNRRDVAILQMMRLAGDDTIKSIAQKHAGRLVLAYLCSDIYWLNGLMYSGPTDKMDVAITNLAYIFTKYSEMLGDPMAHKIATTAALEFARNGWEPSQMLERFTYYYTSYNEKKLNVLFSELEFWDMRIVLGASQPWAWGSVANLTWMRDNVRLPQQMYTGAAYQVPYRLRNVAGDSIHGAEYLKCFMKYFNGVRAHAHRDIGGVCGALSHFGTFGALASGLPAITMGEPGHCAYTVRVNGEWIRCNSIYWQHSLHRTLWSEPAWDYLILMQDLYSNVHTTMVSDEMVALGDILASQRKQYAAFMCYENAIVGQPINWAAILKYNAYLKEKAPDNKDKWLEFHDWIIDGIAEKYHNAASRLLSKYIYPNLLPQIEDRRTRIKMFAAFFKKCKTMGNNRWDINPLLSEQIQSFETDKEKIDYMKDTLRSLVTSPDYAGAAMAWGLDYLGTIPDTDENVALKEDFTEVIIKALSSARTDKKNKDATWAALGEAIFTASTNRDRAIFQAIGKLSYRKCKKNFPNNKLKFKGFSGTLLSESALIYSDKEESNHSSSCLNWAALQREGGMMTGKSNVTVEMEKRATINGVVIITSKAMATDRPFVLMASDDGQNWSKVCEAEMEGAIMRFDTRKLNLTARCLRLTIEGAMQASDMTTGIPVVGFYVYGKKLK